MVQTDIFETILLRFWMVSVLNLLSSASDMNSLSFKFSAYSFKGLMKILSEYI